MAPDSDLTAAPAAKAPFSTGGDGGNDIYAQFGEIDLGGDDDDEDVPAETDLAVPAGSGDVGPAASIAASFEDARSDEEAVSIPDFEIAGFSDEVDGESVDEPVGVPLTGAVSEEDEPIELPPMEGVLDGYQPVDLPLMGGMPDGDDPAGLPLIDGAFGDDGADDVPLLDADTGEEVDLPLIGFDEDDGEFAYDAAVGEAADSVAELTEDTAGELHPTRHDIESRIAAAPDDVALRQRLVEVSYLAGDPDVQAAAYLGLAGALERAGQVARARAAYQQVLQADPSNAAAQAALNGPGAARVTPVKEVAAQEDYVDLGALILGDDEEKTTRFTVAYQEPSGDEDADFAKMLSQFKEKVSESLDADDVRAHHDLGTAYKEMGLLDEAISETIDCSEQ